MVVVGLWCISKQAPSGSDWPALLTGWGRSHSNGTRTLEGLSLQAGRDDLSSFTMQTEPDSQSHFTAPQVEVDDSFTLASRAVTDRLHEAQLQGLLIRWRPPLEWKGDNHR